MEENDKVKLKDLLINKLGETQGDEFMASVAQNWFNDGWYQGEAVGETKKSMEIAKKMLMKGKNLAEIIEFTDLSREEIEKLK